MRIGVIGTGYVGLVLGACLAETGNHVICTDIDKTKIKKLNKGQSPIYEPGLESLLEHNISEKRLNFTTDVGACIEHAEVVFIAVGTPPDEDGSADLQHVLAVAETIGQHLNDEKIIITKSTVPVGTAARVREAIERFSSQIFHVCSNPEFLKEGDAIEDFMKPDRIIIGVESHSVEPILEELYHPFVRSGNPILFMDIASAEITKYAANAMLAVRISFINQISALCEATGADVDLVQRGIGSDSRIGPAFLYAGSGYGGSCFPKDVRALIHTGDELGIDMSIPRSAQEWNESQKEITLRKLIGEYGDDLSGRTIAVWGLSFKPETDDLREATSIALIPKLVQRGAKVIAHDPKAIERARKELPQEVQYTSDEYAACKNADALLILTEWMQYRRPDLNRIKSFLRHPLIIDGRNLFDPARMEKHGFTYLSVGRRDVR
ncbi:UDP-glucose dehydrogenase family protein [Gemmatimonadota bacterium]